MKVAGAAVASTTSKALLPQKLFSTLLELVKPLSHNQALVSLKGITEITLSIKEPLEAKQLYHATISKSSEGYLLKELFKLPANLKQILALKPLMNIEQLITQLAQGKSPQKIVFEALSQQILQSSDKEQVETQLQQILQFIQTNEAVIPLTFHDESAYVKFKKREKKASLYRLPFEAYFQTLGVITGHVAVFENKKQAHIRVLTTQTQEILQADAKKLPMELFVTIDKQIKLTAETSLLDIQV